MQSQLTDTESKFQREELRKLCDVSKIKATPGQSKIDMLQVQLITTRSQQTRIL